MLVLVLMMLDLLSKSADILAYPGNGQAELLHYVSLRVPQLVARFLPYSVLLATIITLATFNQNSEVVAMKAAGLSAHQILAPLLLAALAGRGALVRLQRARRDPRHRRADGLGGGRLRPGPGGSAACAANVYLNDGNDILLASRIAGTGRATR